MWNILVSDVQHSEFVVVQDPDHVRLFLTPWTIAWQASLSLITSQSLPKFMSIESVMPSNHFIFCCPLFFLRQSFPASGSFPMSCLFESSGQSIGASASASVLSVSIQDLFPLRLTGLISLLSKGLPSLLQHPTVQKHLFLSVLPSLWSNSHICTWLLVRP